MKTKTKNINKQTNKKTNSLTRGQCTISVRFNTALLRLSIAPQNDPIKNLKGREFKSQLELRIYCRLLRAFWYLRGQSGQKHCPSLISTLFLNYAHLIIFTCILRNINIKLLLNYYIYLRYHSIKKLLSSVGVLLIQ